MVDGVMASDEEEGLALIEGAVKQYEAMKRATQMEIAPASESPTRTG